jgi:hypothetical protein
MGVGYPLDIVVCVALGVDMFDCVYPTRTARFGVALYTHGTLRLKAQQYGQDLMAIEANCPCICCRPSRCQTNNNNDNSNNNNNSRSASDSTTNTVTAPTATRPAATRAALHAMFKDNSELACQLLTQHNLCYMMRLLRNMRMAILQGRERYGAFIRQFLLDLFVFLDGKIRKEVISGQLSKVDGNNDKDVNVHDIADKGEEMKAEEASLTPIATDLTQLTHLTDEIVPDWVRDALKVAQIYDAVFPLKR